MSFRSKFLGTHMMPYPCTSRQTQNLPSTSNFDIPPYLRRSNDAQSSHNKDQDDVNELLRPNFFGKAVSEKTYFYTGTAERVLKWHKLLKNIRCFYEVIASIVSIQEGELPFERIFLLKDSKGPILKVFYFTNQQPTHIVDYKVGDTLRIVGIMSSLNTLNAISLRTATVEEIATLKRFCYISDFAINQLVEKEQNGK